MTIPELAVRRVNDVAANSIGLVMSNERSDKPWNCLVMHVDQIIVKLYEDCLRREALEICP